MIVGKQLLNITRVFGLSQEQLPETFLILRRNQRHIILNGVQGVVMRNTIAYLTQQSSSPSRGIPCSHKRGNDPVTAV